MDIGARQRGVTVAAIALAVIAGVALGSALLQVDVRLLLATATIAATLVIALRYRSAAAVAVLGFLPFLGLIRRLLIPLSGWPTLDPLLLIAPITVITLTFFAWHEGHLDFRASRLTYWLTIFAAWMSLEMANPSGGLLGNVAGAMYVLVPVLWFYVGRVYGNDLLLRRLLTYVLFVSVAVALYGLYQTLVGFPPWDEAWINLGGYEALHVGEVIRAFGTFPSSAEYGFTLGIGFVIAFALLIRTRAYAYTPLLLAAMTVTGIALVLESQRSALIFSLIACGLVWATVAGGRRQVVVRVLMVAAVGAVAYLRFAHGLGAVAVGGPLSGLVSHDTAFLASPFAQQSTLPGHLALVVHGIVQGFERPWGYGLGSVSIAAKLGMAYGASGTEFDISNAFVAGGIPGGALFMAVWFQSGVRAFRISGTDRWELAAVLGILMAVFGNWLNGGQYFVGALVWFVLGVADRRASSNPQKAI